MGIVEKDRGRHAIAGVPIIIPIHVDGALAAGNGAAFYKNVLFPITVKSIQATLGTLHTTSTGGDGSVIQVRNVTDTLDLMDTPNRLALTDTFSQIEEVSDSLLQNRAVAIGDVLAVDVDVIDTGTGAADLTVFIVGERRVI